MDADNKPRTTTKAGPVLEIPTTLIRWLTLIHKTFMVNVLGILFLAERLA
jgi:hypothetical protein